MTTIANLMGMGVSGGQAQVTATGLLTNSQTATGNSQGTALLLPSDFVVFTTVAASTGAVFSTACKPGDFYVVVNHGASALSLYPPLGGTIAGGATNAAFSVASKKTAMVICIDPLTFAASVSA